MKNRHCLAPLLGAALLSATAIANLHSQTWETFLPRPEIQEASGTQVLIDPFSADPSNPAVLIGPRAENGQILYVQPVDATAYQTTPMAGSLGAVFGMNFNAANASVHAVGKSLLVTTPPFPRKNP